MSFYFNGTPVAVLDPISEANLPSQHRGALEIAGSVQADIRLTDYSETFPAGSFRWHAEGDKVYLQRNLSTSKRSDIAAAPWDGDVLNLIVADGTSGSVDFSIDEGDLTELLELLAYEIEDLTALLKLAMGAGSES